MQLQDQVELDTVASVSEMQSKRGSCSTEKQQQYRVDEPRDSRATQQRNLDPCVAWLYFHAIF